MKPSIAFIICSEGGYLERMSVLFAQSLRTFGGSLKDTPIYSYAPRSGNNISGWASKQFDSLQVTHQHLPLNREFHHYPVANKVFALSHAEATLPYDILVFADSDKLILAEPNALLLAPNIDITLTSVGSRGIGIRDEKDTEYEYWQQVYKLCNVQEIGYTQTTIDAQRIQGYWNSGLVAARTQDRFFAQWESNFLKILKANLYPKNGVYHTDQSALSATIMAHKTPMSELPKSYNYPIHRQSILSPAKKIEKLSEMVTVHYHDMFRKINTYAEPHPFALFAHSDPQLYEWLVKHLDLYGVYSLNYPKRLSSNAYWWMAHKLQRIQERLHF